MSATNIFSLRKRQPLSLKINMEYYNYNKQHKLSYRVLSNTTKFQILPQPSSSLLWAHINSPYIPTPPSSSFPSQNIIQFFTIFIRIYCILYIIPFNTFFPSLHSPFLPFFSLPLLVSIHYMASEPEPSEVSALFERLVRNRDMSFFLPFILGFTNASFGRDGQDPDQEAGSTPSNTRERIILVNPFTQGMVVIEGTSSLETLLREMGPKIGQPPASKESIEAMPSVEIGEGDEGECVICLEEWESGGIAKEMPCKHKFHANCIEKWLGIHGSCPVCRYKMPADEKEVGKKRDEEEGERRRGEIWVSFSFNGGGRGSGDSNEASSNDSNDSSSSPGAGDSEVES